MLWLEMIIGFKCIKDNENGWKKKSAKQDWNDNNLIYERNDKWNCRDEKKLYTNEKTILSI